MTDATLSISDLLYRYAEAIDAGRLEEAAALFRHARIEAGGNGTLDAQGLLALWRRLIILYPCGTPRTRHLISNPIIEIDESAGTATARSCYTVFQATEQLPLQAIASGRYLDRFARIDGQWCFTERQYRLDLTGDLSRHLQTPAAR
jgi:3-phenylpropionate/cinnamic acid dioxygenase small subunit